MWVATPGDYATLSKVHHIPDGTSDVDAGRLIGAAVAAQLQSSPVFRAQLAEAAREIRAAQASGADAPDCSVEQAAAAMTTAGVK